MAAVLGIQQIVPGKEIVVLGKDMFFADVFHIWSYSCFVFDDICIEDDTGCVKYNCVTLSWNVKRTEIPDTPPSVNAGFVITFGNFH